MYTDSRAMTAAAKTQMFETFKKVVDNQDTSLIDETLYKHLYQQCGFHAHFNIRGFIAHFSGIEGFRRFVEHFDVKRREFGGKSLFMIALYGQYDDVNGDMAEYVAERIQEIFAYAKMDSLQSRHDLATVKVAC